jgi:hypothetical protein
VARADYNWDTPSVFSKDPHISLFYAVTVSSADGKSPSCWFSCQWRQLVTWLLLDVVEVIYAIANKLPDIVPSAYQNGKLFLRIWSSNLTDEGDVRFRHTRWISQLT